MNRLRLDRLLRGLSIAGTRRTTLRLLALMPVTGVLAGLFDEESEAGRCRKRRQARHHFQQKGSPDLGLRPGISSPGSDPKPLLLHAA